MTHDELKNIFKENYTFFAKSIERLKVSLQRASRISLTTIESIEELSEEDLETLETLLGRFSRSIDIFINKVLRSLDLLEEEDISRKLDIIIRAEKRAFVPDYNILIDLKNLRNELAHEYIEEELLNLFKEVKEKAPIILEIKDKLDRYIEKYNY